MELSALSLAELDPEKFMKDAKHLHCFKNLELNREKAAEVRNWEPEEPCRRNTHQRNITAFCCCCGPREEMRAARQGLCPAGQTPAPPSQEGFVSSYEVLAYFWNKWAQHHLSSSSPFTLWFISACPRWVSNAFMLSVFFPTLAKPGPVC